MTTDVQSILGDLYDIDPGLREHEAHLIPLIRTLQSRNPGQEPDERFVAELRSRLQAKAAELSEERPSASLHKFFYLFGGAFAALIIGVPVTYYAVSGPTSAPMAGMKMVMNETVATPEDASSTFNSQMADDAPALGMGLATRSAVTPQQRGPSAKMMAEPQV